MQRRSGRKGIAPSPVPNLSDPVPTTSTGKRGKTGGGPGNKKKKEQEVEVSRPSLRSKEQAMNEKDLEEILNAVESEGSDDSVESDDSLEDDLM